MIPKIADSPEKLNQVLNDFDWSCIVDNKRVESTEENWNKYRVLLPNQFLDLRAGCCWDYCNFQSEYFDAYFPELKYKLFIIDSEESNHTFMTYEENDRIKLFESSYKKYSGVYEFKEEHEVRDFYLEKMNLEHYRIYNYKRLNKNYGILAEEFMSYIWTEGKLLYQK